MISDNERREVARRLRGLDGNAMHVRRAYEDEGSSILCNDQADYYQICYAVAGYLPAEHMHPCDYEELHDRLADLIEPQPITGDTSDGYHMAEEMFGKMRHSTKEEADAYDAMLKSKSVEIHPVDRDALLALAEEMQGYADGAASVDGFPYVNAGSLWSYADRIREALGVGDD